MADPINAAIVDELLAVYSATPGELAVRVHRSLGISRPVVSTHLTQLRQRRVIRLLRDGTMSLSDPGPIALILQTSRDFAKAAHMQAAKDESAFHYRTQRRINKGLQNLQPPQPAPIEAPEIERVIVNTSAASLPYATIASDDRTAAEAHETTSDRASSSSGGSPGDRTPMSQAEIDEMRRLTRANFPFDTPWPTKAQRRAVARGNSRPSR